MLAPVLGAGEGRERGGVSSSVANGALCKVLVSFPGSAAQLFLHIVQ